MSYAFSIFSALAAAALMLFSLRRYAAPRDFRLALMGFGFIFILTGGLGISGVLNNFTAFPPPFLFFLVGLLGTGLLIILSPWGSRVINSVPLRVLIALQGFRVLPEFLLDLSFREGLAPVQMTWHGRNADILSAGLALLLASIWPRLRRPTIWAWIYSLIAFALLINIVSIAVLSAPVPFRVFRNEPANTFVTGFPYIWLPGVHVLIAWVLHGLTFRRLGRGPVQ